LNQTPIIQLLNFSNCRDLYKGKMTDQVTTHEVLTTADGVPLKISLKRAMRRKMITSLLLVTPLFLFILLTFLMPITDMLLRSVDNKIVGELLPRTIPLFSGWDENGQELPGEDIYRAMVEDMKEGAEAKTILRLGRRLNFERSGMSSLFRKSSRTIKRLKQPDSYKAAMLKIDKHWGDIHIWRLIKRESGNFTNSHFLSAIDRQSNDDGTIGPKPEYKQIYIKLFGRTMALSLMITFMTVLLGYPISYLLATLPTRISNMLMILVLLPFWTSLLVRTTAWIALLQKEGVLNDIMVAIGIISNDHRIVMIHNKIGTVLAMTHILLPFMVLPLFSVMKTIPESYMRAARSLGATRFTAFRRIYLPNSIPGIGAGGILVFILAIGYYITPELVGGVSGTFISNMIAYHVQGSLNWGLGAALGTLLLMLVLALYILYDKIVGIDNMKLG
jgi:putative spermidine/putrescine transport system permease protein